jgi:hypothetical protein
MGAQGTTTINFGAFPGTTDTSVNVTGQGSILSGSLVEAWVIPTATADHNVGEHIVDPPLVIAGNVVASTGFTIYASTNNNKRHYGQFTVAWVWN